MCEILEDKSAVAEIISPLEVFPPPPKANKVLRKCKGSKAAIINSMSSIEINDAYFQITIFKTAAKDWHAPAQY